MLVFKFHKPLGNFRRLNNIKLYSQQALQEQNEYTDTPEYPQILDQSSEAIQLRKRQEVHKKIRKLNTVEEKQIGLNMPRYYGFKCVMLNENKVPYNAMPLVKSFTRTHFIPSQKLPDTYTETQAAADEIVKEIKPYVEELIIMEKEGIKRNYTPDMIQSEREDVFSKILARQINRIIINNLSDKVDYIVSSQVDYDPHHEAFWMVGGVDPPSSVKRWRLKLDWLKHTLHDPVDRAVQYIGSPILAVRSNLPLKPFIPYSEAENPEFKVEKFALDPVTVGYTSTHRHGTNIPGFWPGERDEYGVLSIHKRGYINDRKESFGSEDHIEALHCQAMKASFGWLLAQANYLGFTTYNDITYPLATQTLITNGQLWSLYAYQLNTVVMHGEQMDKNSKHNICFGTQPMKLYENVKNGKVNGLNDDVLKMIVQMYLNSPAERDHEMKPYLGEEEQVVADIEDDKKRCWLEDRYKHLMRNQPRQTLVPEVYHWEQIYKIKHQMRFFERKVRPFELGKNPFQRKLNEHVPQYIPKALRPYPKCRKKFEDTYYPDV